MVDRVAAGQYWAIIGGLAFHLFKLLLCAGETDLQSFDLAEPVVLLGFGGADVKVGDDLVKPVGLGGSGRSSTQRRPRVLVNTGRAAGAVAVARCDLAEQDDNHERRMSDPMPFLFQRHPGAVPRVVSPATVLVMPTS
jgi:hypothetical protein